RYSGGIWERSSSRSARPSERQAQRSAPLTLARSTMIQPVPPHFSQTGCVDITPIMVQTYAQGGWVSWPGRSLPHVERAVRTQTGPVASIHLCEVEMLAQVVLNRFGEACRNTPQNRDSLEFPAQFAGISVTVPGFAPRDTPPRLSCPQNG